MLTPVETSKHFVSNSDVINITNDIDLFKTGSKNNNVKKTIESITKIPDENGNSVYYIINYNEGGFIILSADNRINPILAFSNSSNFSMDQTKYPSSLVEWLWNNKETVVNVRKNKKQQSDIIAKAWLKSSMQNLITASQTEGRTAPDPDTDPINPNDPDDSDDSEGSGCSNTYTTVGPIISTTWGQFDGYNNLVETPGCNTPTGCVATAMAQIMRYHEYPNNYNWSNMSNTFGTIETAQLMFDIGEAVDMDYGCDRSSADTENEATSSFKEDFGYSSATYADFNHSIVKQQLNLRQPVILKGGRNTGGWGPFGAYTDGHAWVCDGYLSVFNCTNQSSSLLLYMNWGWDGDYNAWYAFNNWNPGEDTYNYKRGMIYNIHP